MEWLTDDLVKVLTFLLPGFAAAWVFHGLTAHPKGPTPFDQIVQALVFTAFIQSVVTIVGGVFSIVGGWIGVDLWSNAVAQVLAVVSAMVLGLLFAWLANNDKLHARLRECHVTSRTSHPTQWFAAFHKEKRWVTLHLKEEDLRIHGWPSEWPDNPKTGHFLLMDARWLQDDNSAVELSATQQVVLDVNDVKMIEIMRYEEELETEPGGTTE